MGLRIEDYALIGDTQSAALVAAHLPSSTAQHNSMRVC